ncbi:MAG: hypothetical protein VXW65_09960 [Pseudomonadota bacterium]|nr:hypothetical protein [Pseudomonadota bacterium]
MLFASLLGIGSYVLSPYTTTWHLKRQLGLGSTQHQVEAAAIEHILPAALWQHPKPSATPQIGGHGQHYLDTLWPVLQQQAHQAQFLRLQLQFYAHEQITQGYQDSPNQFVLQLGQSEQLRIQLQRQGFWRWQVYSLCSSAAQPLLDLNTCPSDSR